MTTVLFTFSVYSYSYMTNISMKNEQIAKLHKFINILFEILSAKKMFAAIFIYKSCS